MKTADLFFKMQATLGEGPVFHSPTNSLFWTDILEKRLYSCSLENRFLESFAAERCIGAFAFCNNEKVVVAADDGFFFYDLDSGIFQPIGDPEKELPHNRFNDGKCDAMGRFWAGTMEFSPSGPNGSLYRLDGDGHIDKMETGLTIANGLAWNHDNTKMYHVDSGKNELYSYDFDLEKGTISNREIIYTFEESYGTPDGMAIDSAGHLFIAIWGGSKVIRFDPSACRVREEIAVPAPHVTSVTFGGNDFKTLFITTARDGLSNEQLSEFPLSGSIFKVEVEVAGCPLYQYQSSERVDSH